jgi:uncharacterized protein YpuA (DUF1002 family)
LLNSVAIYLDDNQVNNVINNSFDLQLNGDSEKIAEQLQNFPPEAIQSLTEAIAMWFGQNKIPTKI